MPLLHIQADPTDWDSSIIRAVGLTRNGRKLAYIPEIQANALPEPYLTIWHAAVTEFQSLGQGAWDCANTQVHKTCKQDDTIVLICNITANYPDGTIDRMQIELPSPEMIAFFDYFTDEINWPNPAAETQV